MKRFVSLFILIMLLVCNAIYWGSQKEGFHVDEMFSYEQVGNTEYPKPEYDRPNEPAFNSWHSRAYYVDYLTIDEDEAFNISAFYSSASKNTAHPPLYLTLLGMFISVFSQGYFTKWSGIAFNIVFFIPTLLMIYAFSRLLLRNDRLALLSLFINGVNIGIVSIVVFIRCYMMLAFFTMTYLYYHLRVMMEREDQSLPTVKSLLKYLLLILLLILGAFTHYYFLIFAFLVGVAFSVILLLAKEIRLFLEYASSCLIGLSVYSVLWPKVFRDIFSAHRGTEAISNFTGTKGIEYWTHVIGYIYDIDKQCTGGFGALFLATVLLLLMFGVLRRVNIDLRENNDAVLQIQFSKKCYSRLDATDNTVKISVDWLMCGMTLFTTVSYILLIARISPILPAEPRKVIRYITNILPFLVVIMIFFLDRVFLHVYSSALSRHLTWIILTALVLSSYLTNGVGYLYRGMEQQLKVLDEYTQDKAIYVSDVGYHSSNLNIYFTKPSAVFQVDIAGIENLSDALNEDDKKEILLFIDCTGEINWSVLQDVYKILGATNVDHLFETCGIHRADVFVLQF